MVDPLRLPPTSGALTERLHSSPHNLPARRKSRAETTVTGRLCLLIIVLGDDFCPLPDGEDAVPEDLQVQYRSVLRDVRGCALVRG